MRLSDIRVEEVQAGKNWRMDSGEGAEALVSESAAFGPEDAGLFSAAVKFGDGSVHPGLVAKSFARGGDETDLFVHTKFGWLNLQANGFMRAVGKYSHEIFPFEYYFAAPWKAGKRPVEDRESPHRRLFSELMQGVKSPTA